MASSSSGIISWALAIRTTMVNDPGRQSLEEEIQKEGFSFLENYLEDILAGPGPIIELMKTPGRNKSRPQTRAASAKAMERDKKLQLLMTEDAFEDKENYSPLRDSPLNKFHEALLQARDEDLNDNRARSLLNDDAHSFVHSSNDAVDGQEIVTLDKAILQSTVRNEQTTTDPVSDTEKQAVVFLQAETGQGVSAPNELSVIMEDEEADRSRKSIDLPGLADGKFLSLTANLHGENFSELEHPSAIRVKQNDAQPLNKQFAIGSGETYIASSSSFESIPLDSSASSVSKFAESSSLDSFNPISTQFPVIGAPSPLRKSFRTPLDSSFASTTYNKATSTTRSSWLIKAREAKALEETTKKYHSVNTDSMPSGSSAGSKRKSEEISGSFEDNNDIGSAGRKSKVYKAHVDSVAPEAHMQGTLLSLDDNGAIQVDVPIAEAQFNTPEENPEGIIDRLKKTVEGLNSKAGKSLSRSLGAAAATALAEAKAAAEAKVAEKNAIEGKLSQQATPSENPAIEAVNESIIKQQSATGDKRLSVTDLISTFEGKRSGQDQGKASSQPIPHHSRGKENEANISSSTTPSLSPPKTRSHVFSAPKDAVFANKQPVFRPPEPKQTLVNNSLKPLSINNTVMMQSSFSSTQISSQPESLFEHDPWQKQTQETDYNDIGFSQTDEKSMHADTEYDVDMDADDSWHAEDQIVINQLWDTANCGDDDTTWSTNPTKSQKGYTATSHEQTIAEDHDQKRPIDQLPSVKPVQNSQQSSQATSSNSQMSFLSTATKLVSSVLGGVKKTKTEPVKSIQLAAAAAKKQQEEKDKKSARLKDMEARRQQVLQKKMESDKAQEERKGKEENERRKREKEDLTDKRPLKLAGKKVEEDTTKKRKLVADGQKKAEKKAPSKDKDMGTSRVGKPASSAKLKDQAASSASSSTIRLVGDVEMKAQLSAKMKGKMTSSDEEVIFVKSTQKQARAIHQTQAQMKVPVATEHIELPDINSEYSDSEDEGRARTFDPPHWAQSPEIREALQAQSKVNPDDVFGAIKPLRMDEMFKARNSRFRARTSSANWLGSDKLTIAEQLEYNQRMGFQS